MIKIDSKNIRIWSRLGPSGAVGSAAMEMVESNPKVLMLTADLCFFSGLERFREQYPDKLYNFGIAEQNMVGAAGGLAKEGFIPFVSTYASFCSSRCADQVRVNMAYMKLPIKMLGLTAGYGAGILGATHISVEDIAFMRSLPNIVVLSPADCTEVIKCMLAAAKTNDPTYIRLTGPVNTPVIYKEDYDFEIGKAIQLKQGEDVCFIAAGSMVSQSLKAAAILEEEGISCSVINMHTIKPLDEETVNVASDNHRLVITVEEHSILGGLGSAVSEVLVKKEKHAPLDIIGIEDLFVKPGDYQYQIEQSGLTGEQIAERVSTMYRYIKE
ncbi:transketolase [Acetatifactor muris]|uniref:1-deoxy-D-xylulose-5-phosphate synthase n=1 Tax=Acetatifactor muris TaxID=879566 RepID=A0A2K4ZA69_9FIRM|nr:transketolase C-terminal domain-containing protein [Acetatifactor muris]MCR2047462.1 transketolase [Acetatifactor muris]SOY27357.1 1-deoxy-D-xylulose-5-phosphate synthase [Acetatifactor muris]